MTLFLIYLLCFKCVYGFQGFFNGRFENGSVPPLDGPELRSAFVEEKYFEQKLDHFDPTNLNVWQQRYFVNDQFFDADNPLVFLFIGGEGEISTYWTTTGATFESAKIYKALLIQIEHRYYGKSLPTEDWSTENLRYLTSELALGDLANFITAINIEYDFAANVKWIAFGGSYSGSLAAWLRQKYPHLVRGAVCSSGPLLALLDFQDYFRVVIEDLRILHSSECVNAVKSSFQQLNESLENPKITNLTSLFNLCEQVDSDSIDTMDIANLYAYLAGNFAGVAQYNNINRNDVNIIKACDIMTNTTIGNELERLAHLNNVLATKDECLGYNYKKDIKSMQEFKNVTSGGRQWMYQTCTEFGFYQTSTKTANIFGDTFPIDFATRMCSDIFGIKFNQTFVTNSIDWTNINYGAYNIKASNVVHVHGSVDPWHPLGLTKTIDPAAPAIFINGTSHCANIYPETEFDIPELIAARKEVNKLIGDWLQ